MSGKRGTYSFSSRQQTKMTWVSKSITALQNIGPTNLDTPEEQLKKEKHFSRTGRI